MHYYFVVAKSGDPVESLKNGVFSVWNVNRAKSLNRAKFEPLNPFKYLRVFCDRNGLQLVTPEFVAAACPSVLYDYQAYISDMLTY